MLLVQAGKAVDDFIEKLVKSISFFNLKWTTVFSFSFHYSKKVILSSMVVIHFTKIQ